MRFVLRLDLPDHQRPDRAKVRECLGFAMQAIGSSAALAGELTIPSFDPSLGVSRHVKIGSWEFAE